MDALRLAEAPMTVREIAVEVLRREGCGDADTETIGKVANTIGNSLRKKPRGERLANRIEHHTRRAAGPLYEQDRWERENPFS